MWESNIREKNEINASILNVKGKSDHRGRISWLESELDIPFPIKRIYYLHSIPGSAVRGEHAHRSLQQVMIAMHGSFEVLLDDGFYCSKYLISDPDQALYIGPMTWRKLRNFSNDAVVLILASDHYDEADYYREYETFIREARSSVSR